MRGLVIVIAVSVGMLILHPLPASASCADVEQILTRENVTVSGGSITTYGNAQTLLMTVRTLDPCGTGTPVSCDSEAHSTTLVANSTGLHWVEIGAVEYVPA